MSYKLNKTNGSLLVELQDGVIDNTSSDLTLVGRNYKGFGESINENFIKLLENFSSTSAPKNAISGQLWYDTSDQRLKVYNGTTFRIAGGPIVSASQPNMVAGDLWIDNEQNKLYFFDGTDVVAVGPNYTASQGKTLLEAITMIDTSGQTRAVLAEYLQGNLVGIHSASEFTPRTEDVLLPYAIGRVIKIGFNPLNVTDNGDIKAYRWNGIASISESLVDSSGVSVSAIDFVRTNERDSQNVVVDQTMEGGLFVKGQEGLRVGYGDTKYGRFSVNSSDTKTVIDMLEQNQPFAIRRKVGNDFIDGITFDTLNGRIGIFQDTPTKELDITGSARITGDLKIEGNIEIGGASTIIDSAELRVQDPQIQLGITDDSTQLDDAGIDGGGFVVNSANGSKDFIWRNATGNFTSNQNIDLVLGKSFRISNNNVLTATTLGSGVVNSSLQNVGVLTSLQVAGNAQLGSVSSTAGLAITTNGDITINNQILTGLANPTDATDATNKTYVDTEIATEILAMQLDITGLSNPDSPGVVNGPTTSVGSILQSIYPATALANGKTARLHCTSYESSVVSGIQISVGTSPDATKVLQKSSIAVDAAGTQNQTVIQDISATNTATGAVALNPTRYTMIFTVDGGTWTHTSTTAFTE